MQTQVNIERDGDQLLVTAYAESCTKDERKLPDIVDVRQCARCQQDHLEMEFTPLWNAPDDTTHFAICPVSKQPILMNMVLTESEFLKGVGDE